MEDKKGMELDDQQMEQAAGGKIYHDFWCLKPGKPGSLEDITAQNSTSSLRGGKDTNISQR